MLSRFVAFLGLPLLLFPLIAHAVQPTVSLETSWQSSLTFPESYTHVRDGDVRNIPYEEYLNRYRERIGSPRLKTSAALQQSAAAHAHYLAQNGVGTLPHTEEVGKVGYTGTTIMQRCGAAGFTQACTEVQAGGSQSGDGYSALDALMMTPYHRVSLIYPYFTEVGCALELGWFVCDIGYPIEQFGQEFSTETTPLVYPFNGQVISTTFYVSEYPMPYPAYAGDFIGPTLMYWPLGNTPTSASVSLIDLTTNTAIESIVSLELDDQYAWGAIMWNPVAELPLNHEFAAHVEGEGTEGAFSASWTFKTQESGNIDFPNADDTIVYNANVQSVGEETRSVSVPNTDVQTLTERLAGRIMLAVDRYGEAYYINPTTFERYYLAHGDAAYAMLRGFGLGITNANLATIPEAGSGQAPTALARTLAGRILLQTEEHGEAWYVHPETFERYYMKDGDEAYRMMRELSLGTYFSTIEPIPEGFIW